MHLLDVNVWVGLAFQRHVHHASAAGWFRAARGPCVFCRVTQAGFLRLASNPSALGTAAVPLTEAWRAYDSFMADPRVAFSEEPAGIEAVWRSNTQGLTFSPKIWMDAYLAAFAELAGFEVVTFDRGFARYTTFPVVMLS